MAAPGVIQQRAADEIGRCIHHPTMAEPRFCIGDIPIARGVAADKLARG